MTDAYKRQIEERFEALAARPELATFFQHVQRLASVSFEEKEFLVDQFRWADQKQNYPQLWSIEAAMMARRIFENRYHYVEPGMFVIRLHGILTEFPAIFKDHASEALTLVVDPKTVQRILASNQAIIDVVSAIRARLNDLDALSIEFLRNQQAHVFPKKYQIQQKKDGTFKRFLPGEEDPLVERIDEVIRYLSQYELDPAKYAKHLAQQSVDLLEQLRDQVKVRGDLLFLIV